MTTYPFPDNDIFDILPLDILHRRENRGVASVDGAPSSGPVYLDKDGKKVQVNEAMDDWFFV